MCINRNISKKLYATEVDCLVDELLKGLNFEGGHLTFQRISVF